MHIDNVFKYLADHHPASFAGWLLETPLAKLGTVEVLQTELGSAPIRADQVMLIRNRGRILHLEFQLSAEDSDPALPLRMLDYWVRLYRRYGLPIDQVVVLIRPTSRVAPDTFQHENTVHRFRMVRIWEQDAGPLLADRGLLPLATIARADDRAKLLSEVASQVRTIEDVELRRETIMLAELVAGLVVGKEVIQAMFNDDIIKHSSIYQWIVEEGLAEGRAEGLAEGLAEGRHEAAAAMLITVLSARFGPVPDLLRSQIEGAPTAAIEGLGGAAGTAPSLEAFTQTLVEASGEPRSVAG